MLFDTTSFKGWIWILLLWHVGWTSWVIHIEQSKTQEEAIKELGLLAQSFLDHLFLGQWVAWVQGSLWKGLCWEELKPWAERYGSGFLTSITFSFRQMPRWNCGPGQQINYLLKTDHESEPHQLYWIYSAQKLWADKCLLFPMGKFEDQLSSSFWY